MTEPKLIDFNSMSNLAQIRYNISSLIFQSFWIYYIQVILPGRLVSRRTSGILKFIVVYMQATFGIFPFFHLFKHLFALRLYVHSCLAKGRADTCTLQSAWLSAGAKLCCEQPLILLSLPDNRKLNHCDLLQARSSLTRTRSLYLLFFSLKIPLTPQCPIARIKKCFQVMDRRLVLRAWDICYIHQLLLTLLHLVF